MWEKFSDAISQFAGGKGFFVGFTVASIVWTLLGIVGIDQQFGAFTLALSILAIYLVIFLQNSQNREQRKQQDWIKNDLHTTQKVLRLLRIIEKRGR